MKLKIHNQENRNADCRFHYIEDNIRLFYRKRLTIPILYLLFFAVTALLFPVKDMLFPAALTAQDTLQKSYQENEKYVTLPVADYYFTGYTCTHFGQTKGYFYYTIRENECILVLLSPKTCEEGLPTVRNLTVSGKILSDPETYQSVLTYLASDLNWTLEGIKKQISPYYLSEPDLHNLPATIFLLVFFATGAYALVYLAVCLVYIAFPILSPTCIMLGRFGHAKELLAQAEEELATLPQLATEDMFITETFFIEISKYGVAVVPIREIIWIYKHSTLHKFLSYHFVISYTLHIVGNKHFYLECPKNIKSNIDGIMDYLAEANHDILVGFNEENRLRVQDIENPFFRFEKVVDFLKKQIK